MTQWLMAEPLVRFEDSISERPILNACSGKYVFGDVTTDAFSPAMVKGDVRHLPFRNDSFAAVFADVPWKNDWMRNVSSAIREMLRVAPVAYMMSPWTYGGRGVRMDRIWVCWKPGVTQALLLVRYVRGEEYAELARKRIDMNHRPLEEFRE